MTVSDTLTPGAEVPTPPLSERRIHELFETLAALVPVTPAVVAERESLSYGELDRRANRLARHLQRSPVGLGAEERVAVALERSPEAVVAVLAVWKAGGAWIPLDLAQPAAHLALQLEESGATFLIAREESAEGLSAAAPPWILQGLGELPPLWQLRIVRLDRDAAEIAAQRPDPLPCAAGPEHLAYISEPAAPELPQEPVRLTHQDLVQQALGLASWLGGKPGHQAPRLPSGSALTLEDVLLILGPLRRQESVVPG